MPDVIVLGLGSMGSAAAYHLAARGLRVVGLDRFTPPHTRGAHAGGSRIIRMTYAEGAAYVPLLHRAYAAWREVEEASGARLVTRTGGLNIGLPESETVTGALTSAREHGLDHEVLDAAAIRARFPAFAPAAGEVAVFDVAAGIVTPERAIETLLGLARQAGADLRFGTAATTWKSTRDRVAVTLADGSALHADRLVVAPGGWAPGLFDVPLRVQRRVQHFWNPPAGFSPTEFPVWIWEDATGTIGYGMPAFGPEGLVKAAFHTPQSGAGPVDVDLGADPPRPGEEQAVRDWLGPRIPSLSTSGYAGGKQCLYTLTPDEHFVIGPVDDRVVAACGFSGHGFKFVPVVGEILADLATGRPSAFDIRLFSPTRFRLP
ncbi:MAG: N-methyl-L-tryptophan oxidase [Hamadaea sp.]|nr:N-methyl-L-tryptophan oxidase [Hamadaea sp.]